VIEGRASGFGDVWPAFGGGVRPRIGSRNVRMRAATVLRKGPQIGTRPPSIDEVADERRGAALL
jgi:hypothetical protein